MGANVSSPPPCQVEVIVFPLGRKSKGVKITRPLVVFPLVDFADFGAPSGRAEGSNGKKGLVRATDSLIVCFFFGGGLVWVMGWSLGVSGGFCSSEIPFTPPPSF